MGRPALKLIQPKSDTAAGGAWGDQGLLPPSEHDFVRADHGLFTIAERHVMAHNCRSLASMATAAYRRIADVRRRMSVDRQ